MTLVGIIINVFLLKTPFLPLLLKVDWLLIYNTMLASHTNHTSQQLSCLKFSQSVVNLQGVGCKPWFYTNLGAQDSSYSLHSDSTGTWLGKVSTKAWYVCSCQGLILCGQDSGKTAFSV